MPWQRTGSSVMEDIAVSKRAVATYVGLCLWLILSQGLSVMYNSALDVALLVAAFLPGVVMLVRRRPTTRLLRLGVAAGTAAISIRFAIRFLGLIRWDCGQAVSGLCAAWLGSGVASFLLSVCLFGRLGWRIRAGVLMLCAAGVVLLTGISAPDWMVTVRFRYAIGSAIGTRALLEDVVRIFEASPDELYEKREDDWIRSISRWGFLSLTKLQLESLAERFFGDPFADDAKLVSALLLGSKPPEEALDELAASALESKWDLQIEDWTARRLIRWRRLFGSQKIAPRLLMRIARQRLREGRIADAQAALDAVIASGDANLGSTAISMLCTVFDDLVFDYEGLLAEMGHILEVMPEYAFWPQAVQAFGRLDRGALDRTEAIAAEGQSRRIRALAHLRLYFWAEANHLSNEASYHLDLLMRLASGRLSRLETALRLWREARRLGGRGGLELIRAGVQLCPELEAPFLILAASREVSDLLPRVKEIALWRLATRDYASLFWQGALVRLVGLLRQKGQNGQARSLILSNLSRIDILGGEELSRLARSQLETD